jgi:excisionase family DNA binding protein
MMLGMNDDQVRPDTPQIDTSAHGQTLDMSMDTAISIREASARANVTEKTIRRWIKSGRLHAIKLGGQYRITVADLERARHDAGQGDIDVEEMSTHIPDAGQTPLRVDMSGRPDSGQGDVQEEQDTGTVDLRPLVEHIAELERQLGQLTEAATIWQVRATQAERQLHQLTATIGEQHDAPQSIESADDTTQEPRVEGAGHERTAGLLDRLRRWIAGRD